MRTFLSASTRACGPRRAARGLRDGRHSDRLSDLSLLLDFDLGQGFFRLHDTIRHFLRDRPGKERLSRSTRRWSQRLKARSTPGRTKGPSLLLPQPPASPRRGGRAEKLDALLLDPDGSAKLEATGNTQRSSPITTLWRGQGTGSHRPDFAAISGICTRDPRQLPVQLATRLTGFEEVAATGFLEKTRRLILRPAIIPLRPSLTPPGAELARLEGHSAGVVALCLLPDGRLASGSWDDTIRLWDVAAGIETACLRRHSGAVAPLCLLPDGRLATGSGGSTIRLWDVAAGTETALEGHTSPVAALCLLPDGRLASGSGDSHPAVGCGGRHRDRAPRGAFRRGRRLVPPAGRAARLGLLGRHDPAVGCGGRHRDRAPRGAFGHRPVPAAGRAARLGLSGQHDPAVGCGGGTETARLEGHPRSRGLCLLPNRRLASGSRDDPAVGRGCRDRDGAPQVAFRPRSRPSVMLPDGRLASGSWDSTIRLSDAGRGDRDRAPHCIPPRSRPSVCCRKGGSPRAHNDRTIRLWDVAAGTETARLEGLSARGHRPVPAAGRAARLGLRRQHSPAVGCGCRH